MAKRSNENSNKLIREFFPKKTNFEYVIQNELEDALYKIKNRTKKCLNLETLNEIFQAEV